MKLILTGFLIFTCCIAFSQDSLHKVRQSFDTSFASDDTLTRSDYLLRFGKVYQTLNRGVTVSKFIPSIKGIIYNMNEDDSALHIIKDRLASTSDRTLNVRNLQMYKILLSRIELATGHYASELNGYDTTLDQIKLQIFNLRNDTAVLNIFRDPSLRQVFSNEVNQLIMKSRLADSTIRKVNILIDNTLASVSANSILIDELQNQNEDMLQTIGPRAFSKETKYFWEASPSKRKISAEYRNSIEGESKITQYYFAHSKSQFYLLLLAGCLFFYWMYYNYRTIRRAKNPEEALKPVHIKYIKPVPIFVALLFIFNLAPLFDLDAPSIYIETIVFVLMIVLTFHFWGSLGKNLRYWWILFVVLSLLIIFVRLFGLPFYYQRCLLLGLNGVCAILASFLAVRHRHEFQKKRTLLMAAVLYVLFNVLAFGCNLFGRITLTHIFGTTAIYATVQTIALIIFVKSMTEAFVLQMQGSRIRRNYPEHFDYSDIEKGISRLVSVLAVIIWLIVFTMNLNIFITAREQLGNLLNTQRSLGSFSFSFRGVLLFLIIIWVANFLQKYIAYFFGDIGDESAFDNKGQRSRLLITRLVLLIAGFLLAVAASGLPIDKITVILGALGVGIGLGLQSIVNNFVSGIILIFDRPIRIGDTVEIGDKKGRVKEISVRSSTLLTADGAEVIMPNGDILSHNIVNWTLSNTHTRINLLITASRIEDNDEVRSQLTDCIFSSKDVLPAKTPEIFINSISSNLSQVKIGFWVKEVSRTDQARSEVYESIYKYLEGKGVKVL